MLATDQVLGVGDGARTVFALMKVYGDVERPITKRPVDAIHPIATYRVVGMGTQAQDLMALETQGPVANRTTERLATSDRGIELYRNMLAREIDKVRQGLDPLGVVRSADHEPIDTDIHNWIEMTRRFPPQRSAAAIAAAG